MDFRHKDGVVDGYVLMNVMMYTALNIVLDKKVS